MEIPTEGEGARDDWLGSSPSEGDHEEFMSLTQSFLNWGQDDSTRKTTDPVSNQENKQMKEAGCQEDSPPTPVEETVEKDGKLENSPLRETLSNPNSRKEQEDGEMSGRFLTSTASLEAGTVVGGFQLGPTVKILKWKDLS